MANYIENLKNLIVDKFFSNSKSKDKNTKFNIRDNKEKTNTNNFNNFQAQESDEAMSMLMDENDRQKLLRPTDTPIELTHYSIIVLSASRFPYIYGFFGTLTIVYMIVCEYFNKSTNELYYELGPSRAKFISLYDLPRINNFAFNLLNTCTGFTGLGIVFVVYFNLYIKYKINKFSTFQFVKLFLSILLGIISNLFHILFGLLFIINGANKFNFKLKNEVNITVFQFLFSTQIVFSILFGFLTTCIIYSLKSRPSYSIHQETSIESNNDQKWLNYKILNIVYLLLFSIIYCLILLHSNNFILTSISFENVKSHYIFIIAILPYVLYFLNISLYVVFYEELRNSNVTFLQSTDKIDYENNDKNIL
jgi:hypothetical protein